MAKPSDAEQPVSGLLKKEVKRQLDERTFQAVGGAAVTMCGWPTRKAMKKVAADLDIRISNPAYTQLRQNLKPLPWRYYEILAKALDVSAFAIAEPDEEPSRVEPSSLTDWWKYGWQDAISNLMRSFDIPKESECRIDDGGADIRLVAEMTVEHGVRNQTDHENLAISQEQAFAEGERIMQKTMDEYRKWLLQIARIVSDQKQEVTEAFKFATVRMPDRSVRRVGVIGLVPVTQTAYGKARGGQVGIAALKPEDIQFPSNYLFFHTAAEVSSKVYPDRAAISKSQWLCLIHLLANLCGSAADREIAPRLLSYAGSALSRFRATQLGSRPLGTLHNDKFALMEFGPEPLGRDADTPELAYIIMSGMINTFRNALLAYRRLASEGK